nr:MAG TPA: hypothetical protein [Caudoviricetes sp.]
MTIGTAMLGAFLLLCFTGMCVAAIYGLVYLLVDHPVILFSIAAAIVFAGYTAIFYVGGNAA